MIIAKTMRDYLSNPMGTGSTAVANKNIIKQNLDSRYAKLIEKHKDFTVKVYNIKGTMGYFFHIIIPSETRDDGTYDIVLRLYPEDRDIAKDASIKRYIMQVFSNCPSFTYTYAYVFHEYNMLIDLLKDKYGKQVLSDNPIVRNPGEVINFEKSIYYACKYITEHAGYIQKITLEPRVKTISEEEFFKLIRDIDTISAEVEQGNNRIKAIKKKQKDDLFHLKKTKDYSKEKNLDKLKVDEPKKDDVAHIKKVSYYRRNKIMSKKGIKSVSGKDKDKIMARKSSINKI